MNIEPDGQEGFDAFLASIASYPLREQEDRLLAYFVETFEGLSADELRLLRGRFIARAPLSATTETMMDVLDGHLMLEAIPCQ